MASRTRTVGRISQNGSQSIRRRFRFVRVLALESSRRGAGTVCSIDSPASIPEEQRELRHETGAILRWDDE
jgi:hypothetical protein